MTHRPRRSALYMPGSNERALKKAATLDVDCVLMDLEDAVGPDDKGAARDNIAKALNDNDYGFRECVVRMNALDTAWGEDDLIAIAKMAPNGILVPKVNSGADVTEIWKMLKAQGQEDLPIWVMMETPLAMLQAQDIAAIASQNVPLTAFVMGTNDLAKDTRAQMNSARDAFQPWLMTCLTAARAYGISILDGVYNNFKDEAGFTAECAQGRLMGMDGKTLIHPAQIEICNHVFSPSDEEVTHARAVIEAFKLPENKGKGVIKLEGKMVELLHAEIAKSTVAMADAIAER